MSLIFPKSSLALLLVVLLSINWMYLGHEKTPNRSKYHKLVYDDSYVTQKLDDKYPYLKSSNSKYIGPRHYFEFRNVFEPSRNYYQKVNIEDHYYNEYRAMEMTSAVATLDQWQYSTIEQLTKSSGPQANEVKCKRELEFIGEQVALSNNDSGRLLAPGVWNIEFLRMLDSWGRPPAETYYGRPYWVGSYRGCLAANLPAENNKWPQNIEFRFCWAKLRMASWPEEDEMLPPMSIRSGICIPKSCDTRMALSHNKTIGRIMQFNFSPFHRQRFNKLINIHCLPHREPDIMSNLPESGRWFVYAVGSWLSLILVSSLTRFALGDERRMPHLLSCLTVQKNMSSFVDNDDPEARRAPNKDQRIRRVDLRAVGVMRFVGSVLICIGHIGLGSMWSFNSSTWTILLCRRWSTTLMSGSYKILDLFFVLGGITAAISITSKFPNDKIKLIIRPKVYLAINLMRYLRLAPLIMLILTFMKSLYPYLSHGPMWDYATYKYSIQGRCQASDWWRVFLWPILFGFRGNSYSNECLLVSWYLITDMKIFLLVPFILYLMCSAKTHKRATWLTIISTLLSMTSHFKDLHLQEIVYYRQFLTYGVIFAMNTLMSSFGETGYFNSVNRLSSVVIGLYAGYWLRHYDDHKLRKWPFWMRGWYFRAMMLWQIYDFVSPALSHYNYLQTGELPSEETFKWVLILKPRIDAIIVAILALRLSTDLSPSTMRNMMPFYKLSKLSYCVFCVHSIFIGYHLSANEFSRPETSDSMLINSFVFIITSSFLISFPLHILFESPVALLTSSLIRSADGTAKSSSRVLMTTASSPADKSSGSKGLKAK